MRKFTDFIVNKRHIILISFIILSIISAILSQKVNINYDIAEYLPNTSETRIGMDIMEQDFKEIKSSSLNLMFENLQEDEKRDVYNYLIQVNGVSSVDYDNTEDYNKENYTLYVINVDDTEDSTLASNVYKEITNHYKHDKIYTSGTIAERNKPVLSIWIVILAVVCAMVILIIMCDSYVEPFLFLTSILIGVLLNNGSNIILGTVSNITSSISAILQMALSMDYSIMLMNRYDQEKQKEADKVKAMKNALYHAFKAISSSSVTTIVGLLTLVFMSFTIGRDLGLVLAKGVLFSLISIFLVLPGLILMFDKWIMKTKKKSPTFKMGGLGKVSYKIRHVALILFIVAFGACYAIKGNLGISYTDTTSNEINKVFSENNQMALIYKSEDEETVAKYLKDWEKEEKIDEVLGYGNTIDEKLTYDKLNQKLCDLGTDTNVEDYLLKIIYYNYYNQEEDNKISFDEFVKCIQNDVYKNQTVSDKLGENIRKDIDRLSHFTSSTQINQKRTAKEIAIILEIDERDIKDILIYYNSKNNDVKLTLNEFIKFMNKDVLTNEKYASKISEVAKDSLNTLSKFTNVNTIQKKMTREEMAKLFGMSEETVKDLYTYYISFNKIDTKMTVAEFANFVLTDVINDPNYASSFNEEMIDNIKMLQVFSNVNTINKSMNSEELSRLFGIDEHMVRQLMLLKYSNTDNGTTMTIGEFVNNVTYIKANTHYLDDLDTSAFAGLDQTILSSPIQYTATQMAKILNIDTNQMYNIYGLIDFVNDNTISWKMTPNEFVTFISENSSNESISNNLNEETMTKLKLLSNIMKSAVDRTSYSYQQLSSLIGVDETSIKNIYTLYISNNVTTKLTPQEFVDFILKHQNDTALLNRLDKSTINDLELLQTAMKGVTNNKKYSSQELASLLGINTTDLELLYGLYQSEYIAPNQKISLKELVDFILDNVIKNPEYEGNFDDETKSNLNTIKGTMNASLKNTKYTRNEIFAILSKLVDNLDKNQVDLLYVYYGSIKEYNNNWTLTVEEFVNYLNNDILQDSRFDDFIESDMRQSIIDAKESVNEAKDLLIGSDYSRVVLNTRLAPENDETFSFIQRIKNELGEDLKEFYIIGDSPMAYEMSQTFGKEFNFITILTMIAIFIVVAITFKSAIIPLILVLIIQCAVYMIMGILSFTGEKVYFISLLIVQSILMGATIDYAILYTTYYIEHRKTMSIKDSIINSYNKSIHTILTSASILIIVTLIVGYFASAIAARICKTISQGTLCSAILILVLLPAVLASCDRIIIKKKKN